MFFVWSVGSKHTHLPKETWHLTSTFCDIWDKSCNKSVDFVQQNNQPKVDWKFLTFSPPKNESPRNPLSYPFVASNLEWCLKFKIEEHVKNRFVDGNWNHNGLGFVNLFSKLKNVKHIVGSIIHEYITSSTW